MAKKKKLTKQQFGYVMLATIVLQFVITMGWLFFYVNTENIGKILDVIVSGGPGLIMLWAFAPFIIAFIVMFIFI